MVEFITHTLFEIVLEGGGVEHIACADEDQAIETLNLKRKDDNNEYHKRRRIVKEIRIMGTAQVTLPGPDPEPVYASVECSLCGEFPRQKINRQPAVHVDEAGCIIADDPRRMINHVYYECTCGARYSPKEMGDPIETWIKKEKA